MYVLTTLLVLGPLLQPGYISALDMSFTPRLPMLASVDSTYPLWALLHVINMALPSQLIQKLLVKPGCAALMSVHRWLGGYWRWRQV